jgi:hypothetical protein
VSQLMKELRANALKSCAADASCTWTAIVETVSRSSVLYTLLLPQGLQTALPLPGAGYSAFHHDAAIRHPPLAWTLSSSFCTVPPCAPYPLSSTGQVEPEGVPSCCPPGPCPRFNDRCRKRCRPSSWVALAPSMPTTCVRSWAPHLHRSRYGRQAHRHRCRPRLP